MNNLDQPLIYLITEGKAIPQNFFKKKTQILELIKLAVLAKVSLIQLREKSLPARLVFELALEAVKITKNSQTKILINDRADIAFAANADGVHLTSNSIPVKEIRRNFPNDFVIGVSTHTIKEAVNAKKEGADFVTFSPVFETPSKKKYGAPQGLEKLREVCNALKNFPVIALGGINSMNYKQVLENGASGFAAIRFLNDEKNLLKLQSKNEQ